MNYENSSPVHFRMRPGEVRAPGDKFREKATLDSYAKLGVCFSPTDIKNLRGSYSMDESIGPQSVNLASAGVPVEFLRTMLPGSIRVVTQARKIDQIVGRTIAGKWSDAEIVQTIVELQGQPGIYDDHSDAPTAHFKVDFDARTVLQFELGMETRIREEERMAAIRQNVGELKRAGLVEGFAINHNRIGFFGYCNGQNRTYGFLNDPGMNNYQTVSSGVGGVKWFQKTYAEICNDLLSAFELLRLQSGDRISAKDTPCTLTIASDSVDRLTTANEQGRTVQLWLTENYSKVKVESAPELNGANGGQSVFYLHADEVPGTNDDGKMRVVEQYVPAVLRLLGTEKRAKGAYELYSSATAGTVWQAPWAMVRFSGIR